MKTALLIIFFAFPCLLVRAQTKGVLTIQALPNQPFTIFLKKDSFPANTVGFAFIDSISMGEHTAKVVFLDKKYKTEHIAFSIDTIVTHFELRNTTDSGWVFYNTVTQQIIYPKNDSAKQEIIAAAKKTKAVVSKVKGFKGESKKNKIKTVVRDVSTHLKNKHHATTSDSVANNTSKPSASTTPALTDTAKQSFVESGTAPVGTAAKASLDTAKTTSINYNPTFEKKGVAKLITNLFDEKTAPYKNEERKKYDITNNECYQIMSDDEVYHLRQKIAAHKHEAYMNLAARKYLIKQKKCISIAQIKYLSGIFYSDAGKYDFLEAAYKNCSNPEAYYNLQALLENNYYIKRFSALIASH